MTTKSAKPNPLITREEIIMLTTDTAQAIQDKGYVASVADIEALTQSTLTAEREAQGAQGTYLKALIATTQSELGFAISKKARIAPTMDDAETKRQLAALESVHTRFYEAVLKAVQAAPLLDEQRHVDRKLIYARRANFARSSKSTLRAWINSGNNLRGLLAAKATKYMLIGETQQRSGVGRKRAMSEKQATASATRLLVAIQASPDPAVALKLLEAVISRLVIGLQELGVGTAPKLDVAIREHKLVRTAAGVFWPAQVEEARTH